MLTMSTLNQEVSPQGSVPQAPALVLQNELILTQTRYPAYYGQLVDSDWPTYEVAVADSSASLQRALQRTHA
jgi:hypothetical protein